MTRALVGWQIGKEYVGRDIYPHTSIFKYVCKRVWNSQASVPVFLTSRLVSNSPLLNVTLYVSPKELPQAALALSSSMASESPKSSLTPESAPVPGTDEDSEDDLPRNSHRDVLAKPCCGSLEVAV